MLNNCSRNTYILFNIILSLEKINFMCKKYLLILFTFLTLNSYSQNIKLLDSLKFELQKNPKDFYLQVDIIDELMDFDNDVVLIKEFENAQIRFKNNNDYQKYFKIYSLVLLLKNQKNDEANQKLDNYVKNIDFKNMVQSCLAFNYMKGIIKSRQGNHSIAENYFLTCFEIIKTSKLDKNRFGHIYNFYASSLIKLGNYQKALSVLFEIIKIKKFKNSAPSYTNIGVCFFHLKQFNKAEYYYLLGIKNSEDDQIANNTANLAILFLESNKTLKAEKIVSKLDFNKLTSIDSAAVFSVLAEIEKQKKNYKKAIQYFKIVEKIDSKNNQNSYLINDYLAIGVLYIDNKNYVQAETYLLKSYNLLKKYEDENAKMEVLEHLLKVNFIKDKNLKGDKYLNEFLEVSDTINSKEIQISSNALNLKYQTAEKESKIKTQQLQIQKEKTNRNFAFAGIGFLMLLSGFGYFGIKSKQNQANLKTQNTLLGLQQNLVEAELSNLNKQLDPHEIKNLLASISPEIQEKEPESYKKMLKLFNLTKASLNSNSITDSIENQLQQIDDFLSLEKSMLPIPLEYSIENTIQNTQTQIPRLLLKNLVENAIKHGIKQQETGGNIFVKVEEEDNFIKITVDDTGKGRNLAIASDSGIGTTTYQKLFETLNPKNKENATFEIIDKQQGTKVEVKIPVAYKYV